MGGHVARMELKKNACRVFWKKAKKRDYKEELGIGGMIILKGILER
jgi:hypothetical protein